MVSTSASVEPREAELYCLEKVREVKSKSWVSSNFEKPKGREETFFFVSLKPYSIFSPVFYITLFLKSKLQSWGWKQACWQPQSPRDAAERMLGLLNSHVDPPNSLLSLCVSVFCLRGSGSEHPPPPLPVHVHTHLAGHSSGAPRICQPAQPARFITSPEFCIWGIRGKKVDSDAVSDKLLYRMETPTESFHIHGLIQILALYVGSYRRLRKTPKLVLCLGQLSWRNTVSYRRPARELISGFQG